MVDGAHFDEIFELPNAKLGSISKVLVGFHGLERAQIELSERVRLFLRFRRSHQ
jgi:hypothetical protein